MAKPTYNIVHLVLLAQAGDRKALDELFKCVQDPIYRYLSGITKDTHLAEDLLQDVFIQVFRKLWLLEEPKAFYTWTYRIASRLAFKRLKQKKKDKLQFDNDLLKIQVNDESLELQELSSTDIDLEKILLQTSPACRAALFLRVIENKSLNEIALILEIPLGTVKSRLASGIVQLKKIITLTT